MNRVILVDDDPIVLIQLRTMIDWEKLNCELVAEAANGEDAIRAIEQYDPQLVITDISMPGITGVELIQYISKKSSQIKVIAISAFDNFNYVRESLKGGAGDYLLKHQLTTQNLEDAICNVLSELEQEDGQNENVSVQEQKEQLFYRLLHTGLRDKDKKIMQELSLEWIQGKIILALGRIEDQEGTDESTAFIVMDESIKYYQEYQILLYDKNLYLFLFRADDERKEEIPVALEQIRTNLKRFCDIEIDFVISEEVDGLYKLRSTIAACRQRLEEKIQNALYGDVVRQAVSFIKEHYKEKISLADISEELSVSASYLSRSFKKETGETIVSYINHIRMKQAKRLMKEGVLTLNEIAYEIGIPNYNYFYTLFKEIYGITPSEYIKKSEK